MWWCLEQLGINGRFLSFLKVLYQSSSCRVKVQDRLSEEFGVGIGLRQGCVLSPLLFSLYINGVVTRLHVRSVVCSVVVIWFRAACSPLTRLWLPPTKKGWRRAWTFWLSGVKSGG